MATYDTGQGAAFTTSSTTLNGKQRSITVSESSLPKVNRSALDTTGTEQYMPGDLAEPEDVTFPVLFDTDTAVPAKGTVETGTITFPLASGQTVAATYAGSGFISKIKMPDFTKNEMQIAEVTFSFDGITGPTFTAAT